MRDYSRISCTFWTRGSGKALRGDADAQRVALYLFSAPGGNMIGLFHLALPTLCHEIGIEPRAARKALATLARLEIAHYDEADELVYLPTGPQAQLGKLPLSPADKRISAVAALVAPFRGHRFHASFLFRWAEPLCLPDKGTRWRGPGLVTLPSEAPCDASHQMADAPSKGLPETDPDPGGSGSGSGSGTGAGTGSGTGTDPDQSARSDSPNPSPPDPPIVLTTLGTYLTETWPDIARARCASLEAAWREAFPGVDLLAESKRARAWEVSDPKRRKVRHAKFLAGWFGRTQERAAPGATTGPQPSRRATCPAATKEDFDAGPHTL